MGSCDVDVSLVSNVARSTYVGGGQRMMRAVECELQEEHNCLQAHVKNEHGMIPHICVTVCECATAINATLAMSGMPLSAILVRTIFALHVIELALTVCNRHGAGAQRFRPAAEVLKILHIEQAGVSVAAMYDVLTLGECRGREGSPE